MNAEIVEPTSPRMLEAEAVRDIADRSGTTVETVQRIFAEEWQTLSAGARITEFLTVLACHRTLQRLRKH